MWCTCTRKSPRCPDPQQGEGRLCGTMGAGASQDWRAAGARGHAFPGRATPGADRDPTERLTGAPATQSSHQKGDVCLTSQKDRRMARFKSREPPKRWPVALSACRSAQESRGQSGRLSLANVDGPVHATLVQINRWALSFTISPMLQLRAQKSRTSWLIAGLAGRAGDSSKGPQGSRQVLPRIDGLGQV